MAILAETTRIIKDIHEATTYKLINDGQTAATSTAVDVLDAKDVSMVIETGAGVSNGVITLEGARTVDYSGTWESYGTVTTNAASQTFIHSVTPTNDRAGVVEGLPVPFMRVRISTGLTGGNADVYLIKRR